MPTPRKASPARTRKASPAKTRKVSVARRGDHDPDDRPRLTGAARKVAQDVTKGLGKFFPATGGFEIASGFHDAAPITNGAHTAVVWQYSGVHRREFQGIQPTNLPVVIRGITVLFEVPKRAALYHRYVDWADVMAQLGLSTTGRPAVEVLPPGWGNRRLATARGR